MEESSQAISKKEQYDINHQAKLTQKKQSQSKRGIPGWVWGVVVIVLAIVGIGRLVTSGSNVTPGYDPLVIHPSDFVKGEATASATLVEFADFQCPACATYASMVDQLVKDNPGKVKMVFRNFPLKEIHPNAYISSQAGQAAGNQGKFWEMYTLLYAKQADWEGLKDPKPYFQTLAGQLGLNAEKFNSDMQSRDVIRKVDQDRAAAIGLGLDSTPTFYLNGKKITNPRSVDDFKQLLDRTQ